MTYVRLGTNEFKIWIINLELIVAPYALWLVIAYANTIENDDL
jgi:hypothetical protein